MGWQSAPRKVRRHGVTMMPHGIGPRVAKVRRWMARATRCDRLGRRRVMRTAIVPAVSHSVAIAALPRSYVKQLRAETTRGFGPIGSR